MSEGKITWLKHCTCLTIWRRKFFFGYSGFQATAGKVDKAIRATVLDAKCLYKHHNWPENDLRSAVTKIL